MDRPRLPLLGPLPLIGLVLLLAACGGCALCSDCEDTTYAAYGGRWQRHDRAHGRVGSVLQPAGGRVELPVDGMPEDLPQPREAVPEDELPEQMEAMQLQPWPTEAGDPEEAYYEPEGR